MKLISFIAVSLFTGFIAIQHPITPCEETAGENPPEDCPLIEE